LTPQSDIEPRKGMPDPKLKKKQFHERMPTPDYDPAIDWIAAKDAIHKAQARYDNRKGPMRILLINASSRSEHMSGRDVEILSVDRGRSRNLYRERFGRAVEILDFSGLFRLYILQ